MNSTSAYLTQIINFGGIPTPLGPAIAQMQAEGAPQRCIDAWIMGATQAGNIR